MTFDELRIRAAIKQGYTISDTSGNVQVAMATLEEAKKYITENITVR